MSSMSCHSLTQFFSCSTDVATILSNINNLMDLSVSYLFTFFPYILNFKSSFRCVNILWQNVQTGDFQNLKTSSVYCRSCLKRI